MVSGMKTTAGSARPSAIASASLALWISSFSEGRHILSFLCLGIGQLGKNAGQFVLFSFSEVSLVVVTVNSESKYRYIPAAGI